jgi:hypothetical protein
MLLFLIKVESFNTNYVFDGLLNDENFAFIS